MNGLLESKNEWCCKYQKVKMNGLQQQSQLLKKNSTKVQQKSSSPRKKLNIGI